MRYSAKSHCDRYKSIVRTGHQPKHDQQIKIRSGTNLQHTYNELLKVFARAVFCISTKQASAQGRKRLCLGSDQHGRGGIFLYANPGRRHNPVDVEEFCGRLVTDFYAAYDAIECPQQKCLIHLIRDLNEELLKHPYDEGLKTILGDFSGLIRPIVETVDRRGLKSRFLGKHRALC